MSRVNTINRLAKWLKNDAFEVLVFIFLIALVTSWLWFPPLWANLTYGDWTCAYKECVVIKEVPDGQVQGGDD